MAAPRGIEFLKIFFFLSRLTFESDVPFSMDEFIYLTCLKQGTFISPENLRQARDNLDLKNRFKSIDIDISDYSAGKSVHFKLVGHWLFRKLVLKGIWFDKYQYEDLYLQQSGDIFDISLHEESVKSIKNLLKDKGYFNCRVDDELVYENKKKTILVRINIKKGKCFRICQIDFDLKHKTGSQKDFASHNKITSKLKAKFASDLIGNFYSKKAMNRIVNQIKFFLRKKGYLNSSVKLKRFISSQYNKVFLKFIINLGPRLIIKFKGNDFLSLQYINENILSKDTPTWLLSPQIIADRLLYEYYKKGYWNVKISYKIAGDQSVLFKIKEGDAVKIERVEVKNINLQLIGQDESFFKELLENGIYDENLLRLGLENLKRFYKSMGFWNFKILRKKIVKCKSDQVYVVVIVNKGKQYFYGGASVSGFEQLAEKNIFKKVGDCKDVPPPFNALWLSEQRLFLINHFQQNGYWFVRVIPEIRFEDLVIQDQLGKIKKFDAVKVFVNWKIDREEQVKFGKTLIRGTTSLPFKTILKELRFSQGGVWSKEKVDLTRNRFKKLDVFKTIQLQPYKYEKSKFTKPILLNLVDDDQFETRFRFGYFLTSKNFLFKRQSTYKVGTSLIVRNLTNNADKLLCNIDLTRFERKFDADYQMPFLFDVPIMSKVKLYANKYVHPVQIGKSDSAYEAVQNGFLLGLSNEYKTNYFWGLNIGQEWMKTSRVRGNLRFSKDLIDQTIPIFFLEPSLVIDTRDDRINVTKGSLSFFSIKMMVPSKFKQTAFRIMCEQSLFCPFFKRVVVGARLRWGYIIRNKFEYVMPIERFYLGGPYSVRGYEKDSLPPLGVSQEIAKNGEIIKQYTIQGGSSMINCNFELRIPIYKSFWTVLFQDIGVLSQFGFRGFAGRWHPATGFGFRYKTPIGALRFDIGWKWKKRLPGDSSYAWYLTLGEAF